jgi:hypothetical protein
VQVGTPTSTSAGTSPRSDDRFTVTTAMGKGDIMTRPDVTIGQRIRQHLPPPRPRTKPAGSTYKRCGCRDPLTGRRLDTTCPLLRWNDHGRWYFYIALPPINGQRRRVRRGGFDTACEAAEAMQRRLDDAGSGKSTVASGAATIDTIRQYLATAIAPQKTPGTRLRVRRRVRIRVRPDGLIHLPLAPQWKDRP